MFGEILVGTIVSLNPDMEKRRKLLFLNDLETDNCEYIDNDVLTPIYLQCTDIHNAEKDIKNEILEISKLPDNWNKLGADKISTEIIDNTLTIVEAIPQSILYYLKPENIYPSQFGTMILDWEFGDDNLLSLEIAKKSIGYFVEKDGKNYKQVDRIEFNDGNIGHIITSLIDDISLFLS